MTNYRVRQVLALGPMPERHLRFLVALATFLGDESRTVRVGFDKLVAASGNVRTTAKLARRELAEGKRIQYEPGRHRGDLTLWTALCLPEKGTSAVGPLFSASGRGPKGASPAGKRGPAQPEKGGQAKLADQRKPDRKLERSASTFSSLSRALAALAAAVPALTEREITTISDRLTNDSAVSHPGVYLQAIIARGEAAEWATRTLNGDSRSGRHRWPPAGDRAVMEGEALKAELRRSTTTQRVSAALDRAARYEQEDGPGYEQEDGPGPRTEACKRRAHHPRDCAYAWCTCPCHGPAPPREPPAGPPPQDPVSLAAILDSTSAQRARQAVEAGERVQAMIDAERQAKP